MKFRATFYLLNYDFSPEFAVANNNGEESAINRKYDWMDELEINEDVIDFKVNKSGVYYLKGVMNDKSFSEPINDMFILETTSSQGNVTQFAVSNKLLQEYEIDDQTEFTVLKVIMKKDEPLSNPIPGIYIAAQDFPEKLIHAES